MHWMEPCGLWLAAFPVGGPEKAVLYLRIGCWLRKLGFSFLRNLSEIGCVAVIWNKRYPEPAFG